MPAPLLDPNVSYLLLVAGMVIAVLALFSPGTGLLELGAFFALFLAAWGISGLNVNLWALIVLVLGVFPFILALRKSGRLFFLIIAILALIGGSTFLFLTPEGSLAVHPALAVVTSLLAILILWIVGQKGFEAVNLRKAIDYDALVGEIGEARTHIREEGTLYIGGEEWSARSEMFIPLGSKARVVARDGLTLIVEPVPAEHKKLS